MRTMVVSIWAMVLLSWGTLVFCEGGGAMASNRTKGLHGMDNRSAGKARGRDYKQCGGAAASGSKRVPEAKEERVTDAQAEALRLKYAGDPKAMYQELIAPKVKDKRTGLTRAESWGRIHDYFIDFLNLNEPEEKKAKAKKPKAKIVQGPVPRGPAVAREDYSDVPVKRYSDLNKYLPKRDASGEFPERWLYWRTLDSKPEIQDGPDGPIARMFNSEFWQGCVIRVKGAGFYKCALLPRGHLKTTIGTQFQTTWKITREPSWRRMLRSVTDPKAKANLAYVSLYFEGSARFRRLYRQLGPPEKREGCWNNDMIQLRGYDGILDPDRLRGADKTLVTLGMETDPTGGHFDDSFMDDVVTERNFQGERLQTACDRVENMLAVLDPGMGMTDIGTKWNLNDPHEMFTNEQFCETIASNSSFMVATCLDADKTVPAPARLTPLEYGKPIWGEQWTHKILLQKRHRHDRFHYGQYFNQIRGTGLLTFDRSWIQPYPKMEDGTEYTPGKLARKKKLNVFIGFDTTSGKRIQKGKLDYFAAFVLGQSRDRRELYLLDGFKERLSANQVARAMVNLALKWRNRVYDNKADSFTAGFEDIGFTNYLGVLLDREVRERTVEDTFSFTTVAGKDNPDRIGALASVFEQKSFFFPTTLVRKPVSGKGEPYDLIKEFMREYEGYPGLGDAPGADDLLAGCGIAVHLSPLPSFNETPEAPTRESDYQRKIPGAYKRGEGTRVRAQEEPEGDGDAGAERLAGVDEIEGGVDFNFLG